MIFERLNDVAPFRSSVFFSFVFSVSNNNNNEMLHLISLPLSNTPLYKALFCFLQLLIDYIRKKSMHLSFFPHSTFFRMVNNKVNTFYAVLLSLYDLPTDN